MIKGYGISNIVLHHSLVISRNGEITSCSLHSGNEVTTNYVHENVPQKAVLKRKFGLSWQVFLVACVQCWVELTTTFPSYNAQPRTEKEAQDAGWTKIEDATDRYAMKK